MFQWGHRAKDNAVTLSLTLTPQNFKRSMQRIHHPPANSLLITPPMAQNIIGGLAGARAPCKSGPSDMASFALHKIKMKG
jgi:hypothetical protein